MTLSRGVMEKAFAETVRALPTRPEDAALIALGRRLARLIDQARGEDAEDPASGRDGSESKIVLSVANEYHRVLTSLGATPHARSAMFGKLAPAQLDPPKSRLQQQRDDLAAQRAKRDASG